MYTMILNTESNKQCKDNNNKTESNKFNKRAGLKKNLDNTSRIREMRLFL